MLLSLVETPHLVSVPEANVAERMLSRDGDGGCLVVADAQQMLDEVVGLVLGQVRRQVLP